MDPRASQLWTDTTMIPGPDEDLEYDGLVRRASYADVEGGAGGAGDDRTPLDRTIDRIGMGSYQWTLLSLCGFGWLADNMWLQAIAIILPRIQEHYKGIDTPGRPKHDVHYILPVSDAFIGTLSSSMFAGMMIGAIGWGTCSDLMGRSAAFNATLFFTSLFGIIASFSNSFFGLCLSLFLLGTAIGGSMPTDGTLLLEHMPKEKQYLVTALSVFFSFGSVLSALVALLVLPSHSCPKKSADAVTGMQAAACDVDKDNLGWKYLLGVLGLITLSMFLARILFFRLHESPRYLVHAGRPQDAVKSLRMISKFNGTDIPIELEDVRDHHALGRRGEGGGGDQIHNENGAGDNSMSMPRRQRADSTTLFDAQDYEGSPPRGTSLENGTINAIGGGMVTAYASTGETRVVVGQEDDKEHDDENEEEDALLSSRSGSSSSLPTVNTSSAGRKTKSQGRRRGEGERRGRAGRFTKTVQGPLSAWWARVMMVLSPEWIKTTVVVWGVWFGMSLAYTMFNVFLPKLLETRGKTGASGDDKSLEESLWDVVVFTLGGTPGALTMWAVLYGWTPEIFGTKVRGTACGIASALSRIGGMIAPILGGILLTVDNSIPVYASVVAFAVAGVGVVVLKEDRGKR
ncbi:hypothetical protein CVT24_001025 [Panaeolus cyanescens]|uniref:Major facilitator superfamily (MFS) profile domain-containing protein n=1 Tax=Panaeolus cyanescens TaxID=181874 RepID=A0A409YTI6_9AGAR|nr:hypothetical protein CVT24_001025 [Panaeolus cyanescens]